MRSLLVLILVVGSSAWARAHDFPTYSEALQQGVKYSKPVVVFVGCLCQNIDGYIPCRVDVLEGYEQGWAVICLPKGEWMVYHKTIIPLLPVIKRVELPPLPLSVEEPRSQSPPQRSTINPLLTPVGSQYQRMEPGPLVPITPFNRKYPFLFRH